MNSTKLLYIILGYILPCIFISLIENFINPNHLLYLSMILGVLFITLSNLFLTPFKKWVENNNKMEQLWSWAFDSFSTIRMILYIFS